MSKRLEEEETKKYKIVSRILGILTRIGSICCWIGVAGIAFAVVVTSVLAPNVKIDGEKKEATIFDKTVNYTIKGKDYEYNKDGEYFAIKDNAIFFSKDGTEIGVKLSDGDIEKIEKFIENDALRILSILPFILALALVALVFIAIALWNGATVFKNIAKKSTPFTKNNIDRTEKVAKYFIISFIITFIANFIMSIFTNISNLTFNFTTIGMILGAYVAVYILKAGYQLEGKEEEE